MYRRRHHTGKSPNWIVARLAGLFLAAIPSASGGEPGNLGAMLKQLGYEQIELRRTGENHLFLFGRVNGRRRSCLVDTGWSLTTLRTNTAHRLATPGSVDELKLGRVRLPNVPVVGQDLRVNGQPTAFDLVLGSDFLIRHHAVIDCAGRRLYLGREALANESVKQLASDLQRQGYVGATMIQKDSPALTCAAKLNGSDVELLVDTGAMWSCLDSATAQTLGFRVLPTANRITGAAAAGKRVMGVTTIKTLEIGGWKKTGVNFAVLALADWGLGTNGQVLRHVGGILGGDELAASAAVIDFGQRRLWQRGRK